MAGGDYIIASPTDKSAKKAALASLHRYIEVIAAINLSKKENFMAANEIEGIKWV